MKGPFRVAAVLASAVFLLAGLVFPQAAEAFLRLFLVTVALGFIVARAYDAYLPSRMTLDFYSPFHAGERRTGVSEAPEPLRKLTAELKGAGKQGAERREIPRGVRWRLIDEAARRLADHGLDLEDPGDHDAIRGLVSPDTWSLIRPFDAGAARRGATTAPPLSRLDPILNDVEAL